MRTKVRRILGWSIGALAVVALAVAAWYFTLGPGDVNSWLIQAGWEEDPDAPLTATGLLEGIEVALSAELSGRVERVYVDEGDPVEAGDLLLALDSTLLESQLAEAEAGIAVARAALSQAEAGVRSEQIEQAKALVLQAVAARDGAYQAYLDAQAMRGDPQELDDQIDQTRTQVAVAGHLVMEAVAVKDAVELLRDNSSWVLDQIEAGYVLSLPLPNGGTHDIRLKKMDASGLRTSLEYQWWYAWTLVNTAGAGRDGAQNALDELLRVRQNPRELDAAVAEARGRYESAVAMVEMAEANLAASRGGATPEQLDAVRARVGEAEAAKTLVQAQLAKTLVYAPIQGTAVEVPLNVGESAQPGTRLAVIANMETIRLSVYIPEDRLGEVATGQKASVGVDPFPDRSFEGTVVHIASEAEYSPRAVQSKADRVNMVFEVHIEVANPGQQLKPGMPADVSFALLIGDEG